MNEPLNISVCAATKNKSSNLQCPRKKYPNSDFCGIHTRAKNITRYIDIITPNNNTITCNSPKKNNNTKTLKILDDVASYIPKFCHITDILGSNTIEHLKIEDLKYTISELNLKTFMVIKGNEKRYLFNCLYQYYNNFSNYYHNIEKIVKIQSYIRRHLIIRRKRCINTEDLYTLDSKYDIPLKYFYSFKDNNNFHYCFDIRTFTKILEMGDNINPYTTKPLPLNAISKYKKKIISLQKKNINLHMKEEKLPPHKIFEQKVIDVFHKYDMLDNYTNHLWFMNLNLIQLKKFYKYAEDIWNYRAQLPLSSKKKIIKNGIAFNIPYHIIHNIKQNQMKKLQELLIEEMDRFVTEGINIDEKKLGAMLILSALVEVSAEAADALPHLMQFSN